MLIAADGENIVFTAVGVRDHGLSSTRFGDSLLAARAARHLRPDLRVLFVSGYTEDALARGGRLEPGVELLNKPYRRKELADRLRAVLDR